MIYPEENYEEFLCNNIGVSNLDECEYFPRYFTIETCDNCNAHCIMCPKGYAASTNLRLMSDLVFLKILKELEPYANWIQMVCLNSDGEPLIDRNIAKRIRMLKRIGIKRVNISTNASLLTEEVAQELIGSGLDDLRISLDAYTKETYEKIRLGLNFDVVVNNVHNLIRLRDDVNSPMEIRIRMVELSENESERESWLHYWSRLCTKKNDKVQIMPAHTWSGTVGEDDEDRIDYYASIPCVSPFSTMTINYDGVVQLCDSDIQQKNIMGNVMEQTLKQIWNGEKFKRVRELHRNKNRNDIPVCQGCDHWSRGYREG